MSGEKLVGNEVVHKRLKALVKFLHSYQSVGQRPGVLDKVVNPESIRYKYEYIVDPANPKRRVKIISHMLWMKNQKQEYSFVPHKAPWPDEEAETWHALCSMIDHEWNEIRLAHTVLNKKYFHAGRDRDKASELGFGYSRGATQRFRHLIKLGHAHLAATLT